MPGKEAPCLAGRTGRAANHGSPERPKYIHHPRPVAAATTCAVQCGGGLRRPCPGHKVYSCTLTHPLSLPLLPLSSSLVDLSGSPFKRRPHCVAWQSWGKGLLYQPRNKGTDVPPLHPGRSHIAQYLLRQENLNNLSASLSVRWLWGFYKPTISKTILDKRKYLCIGRQVEGKGDCVCSVLLLGGPVFLSRS